MLPRSRADLVLVSNLADSAVWGVASFTHFVDCTLCVGEWAVAVRPQDHCTAGVSGGSSLTGVLADEYDAGGDSTRTKPCHTVRQGTVTCTCTLYWLDSVQKVVCMDVKTDSQLSGQLSLLPSAGQEMSTSQSAVMLCDWKRQVWFIPLVDKRVGGR